MSLQWLSPEARPTLAQRASFGLQLLKRRQLRNFSAWLESQVRQDYLIDKPSPWLTFPAIRWLDRYLRGRTDARVFEYGSGGSTLYWQSRGCQCVSVEHDESWFRRIRTLVRGAGAIDVRWIPPDRVEIAADETGRDPADPHRYQSAAPGYENCSFRRYVSQIDEFPDAAFDVVLVDGRARPSCLLHAVRKVRKGGCIVLDNADRAYYLAQTASLLESFDHTVFAGPAPGLSMINRTDVFIRLD